MVKVEFHGKQSKNEGFAPETDDEILGKLSVSFNDFLHQAAFLWMTLSYSSHRQLFPPPPVTETCKSQTLFLGPVTKFLDWKVFIPLSKLTYGAYLTHLMVLDWYMGTQEQPLHYLTVNMVYLYLGKHNLGKILYCLNKQQ